MAPIRNVRRVTLAALASLLGLALLGPPIAAELLYRYALGGLDAPPPAPTTTASPVALTAYWLASGETMPMKSEPIWMWHWPWWLVRTRASTIPHKPGEGLAVQAARVWLSERPEPVHGRGWGLAFWSATLWMSRNRTAEETTALAMDGAWYGRGARGLEAAADAYFGKKSDALRLHELALLVGLTQAPNRFDPDCRPEDARARRKYVLDRLLDARVISAAEHDEAGAQSMGTVRRECRRE
jgi:hypothetical protein